MSIGPSDFLEAARELGKGSEEVDFRNAASRSYYAAYHRCKPIAKRGDFRVSGRGDHVDVIDALERSFKTDGKILARNLHASRKLRRKADYRIEEEFRDREAALCIDKATKIFEIAARMDQAK